MSSIGKVKLIDERAFKACKQLMLFNTIEGPEIIGNGAFENCQKLMLAPLGTGVKIIGNSSFKNCKNLVSINLSEGLEQIGKNAFENCCCIPQDYEVSIPSKNNKQPEMQKVKIPNKIIVSIPKTVENIGEYAFAGCQNISYVHMMDGCKVQEIQDGTFQGCDKLELFDISNEVQTIGEEAFKDCKSLKQITCLDKAGLPENMKEIKSKAFENCENLGFVLTNGEVKRKPDSFNNTPKKTEANIKDLDVNVEVIDGKVYDVIKPTQTEKKPKKIENPFSLQNLKRAINNVKNKGQSR